MRGAAARGRAHAQVGLRLLKEKHPVLHVLEWLANQVDGEDRRQRFRRRTNETRGDVRIVQC